MKFIEYFNSCKVNDLLLISEDVATTPFLKFDNDLRTSSSTINAQGAIEEVITVGGFRIRPGLLKPMSVKYFNDAADSDNSYLLQCKLFSCFLHYGFKYFNVSEQQANMFRDIDVNVSLKDIQLPHNPIIISLPSSVAFNNDCFRSTDVLIYKNDEEDLFVIAGYVRLPENGRCVMLSVVMTSQSKAETFEDVIKNAVFEGYATASQANDQIDLFRIAINTCLFATNYGFIKPVPKNVKAYERIKRACKKNNSELPVRTYPHEMSFEQDVLIKTVIRGEYQGQSSHDSSGIRKPHWRRGHWHTVCYGEKHSLRKSVFYKPVFVNKDFFDGSLSKTKVNLRSDL